MPFGLPIPEDQAYGDLLTGLQANIADLGSFGAAASTVLSTAAAVNYQGFDSAFNRVRGVLSRGQGKNTADLNQVANTLAVNLAGGAQANAIDLAPIPTVSVLAETDNAAGVGPLGEANRRAAVYTYQPIGRCREATSLTYTSTAELEDTVAANNGFLLIHGLTTAQEANDYAAAWNLANPNTGDCAAPPPPPDFPPPFPPLFPPPDFPPPDLPPDLPPEPPLEPPPDLVIPPPPPHFACPAFTLPAVFSVGAGGGIPPPGSADFCAFLIELETQLDSLFEVIDQWLDANITTDILRGVLEGYVNVGGPLSPGGYLIDGFARLLIKVIDYVAPVVDVIICAFQAVRKLIMSLRPRCGGRSVFVLLAAKWLMDALKKWEIGTDAVAWFVGKIELTWGPVEVLVRMLIAYSMPMRILGSGEAAEAWLQGQISAEVRDCTWRLNGNCPETYLPAAMARSEKLSSDEILRWGHRNLFNTETIDQHLAARGWARPVDRQARAELFWELPTIGDHLHWLARNVDDHDYVQRFGLLDGFAPDAEIAALPNFEGYRTLTDTHGRNFWQTFGPDLLAQGVKKVYAAYHYAAHWVQPAPEQMKEFIYRLRPELPAYPRGFTLGDFRRILAEQDYAPLAIEWFAQTAYRVPALTYLINMYRQGVIGDNELKGYHQDLGYTPQDSDRFVAIDKLQKNQMRADRYRGWTSSAVASAYVIGQMEPAEVYEKMGHLGADTRETNDLMRVARVQLEKQIWMRARSRLLTRTASRISQALDLGMIEDAAAETILVDLGYPTEQAHGVVLAEKAAGRTKLIRQTIQAVRHSFFAGFLTQDAAMQLLLAAGITAEKRAEYQSLWAIQNNPIRKRRTASQIVADLALGMMDQEEALYRLRVLGYDQADQILYLADAQRKIIQRGAKAGAAAARDARTGAAQLAKLANQAKRQFRELQSHAGRSAPKGTLIHWLKRGKIMAPRFRVRMARIGIDPADIEIYVLDAPTDPKVGELKKWHKDKVISDGEFYERIVLLGYTKADAARFLADASPPKKTPPPPP